MTVTRKHSNRRREGNQVKKKEKKTFWTDGKKNCNDSINVAIMCPHDDYSEEEDDDGDV